MPDAVADDFVTTRITAIRYQHFYGNGARSENSARSATTGTGWKYEDALYRNG